MAAVRGLRVSVKAEAPLGPALGLPSPEVESGLERGEPEPMEVEEGELEIVPVRRSLKELIPVRAGGEEEVASPEGEVMGVSAREVREGGEGRERRGARRGPVLRPGASERTPERPEISVERAGGGGESGESVEDTPPPLGAGRCWGASEEGP
jgi:hypothetical protein